MERKLTPDDNKNQETSPADVIVGEFNEEARAYLMEVAREARANAPEDAPEDFKDNRAYVAVMLAMDDLLEAQQDVANLS